MTLAGFGTGASSSIAASSSTAHAARSASMRPPIILAGERPAGELEVAERRVRDRWLALYPLAALGIILELAGPVLAALGERRRGTQEHQRRAP